MKYLLLILAIPVISFAQPIIVWEAPVSISDEIYGNQHPRIALNRAFEPMVIWGLYSEKTAYFSRWTGTGFGTPIRIIPEDIEIFTASWSGPDIASFGDTVYITCKANPEDSAPVYCIHSYDGGLFFSDPVTVDNLIGEDISRFPSIAVSGNGQPIISFMRLDSDFMNPRYVVTKSEDFGNSFSSDQLASNFSGGEVCDCCPVGLATNNEYVATLYRDNLDNLRNSWAGISTNGGASFDSGMEIDQTNWIINVCPSTGPDGIIIGDSLYTVFMSAATGAERIYFSASSLATIEDSEDSRLSVEILELVLENYPRIANYEKATAIVWKDVEFGPNIKILFTKNIEERFSDLVGTVTMFDPDGYNPVNADIAVSPTDVHVVWQEGSTGTVMYRKGRYAAPLSIQENNSINLTVFPNPAYEQIKLVSQENFNQIRIYSQLGICIRQLYTDNTSTQNITIKDLPAGLLRVQVLFESNVVGSCQFVKININ